jgi:FMN-dependent NADH-azoreductase
MKGHNIAVYIVIPLALFSIMSLFDNVQAQTNSTSSTNQIASQQQQQNQNANLTAQALMKTDIVALKNTLMNAQLAIVHGNIEQALKDVMDVETQLKLLKPSPPTKFLNNIHKAIGAIATSETDKSLNTISNLQVNILKAENLIFKAAMENPQVMQQIHTMNYVVPTPQSVKIQPVDTSKNIVPTPQSEKIQPVDTFIKTVR